MRVQAGPPRRRFRGGTITRMLDMVLGCLSLRSLRRRRHFGRRRRGRRQKPGVTINL